jgi:lysophospholipase L1-like esterase
MTQFVPVSDEGFRFEGRIDWRDTAAPVLIWQGTSVEVEFTGSLLALRFGAGRGICYFNLEVDGDTRVVEVDGATGRLAFEKSLTAGSHRLRLIKRTEAAVGFVAFLGLEIADTGKVRAATLAGAKSRPAFHFFGDSITAGACNEDGDVDQWEKYSLHNNALSYAALTAKAFAARYRNVAVGGMGVAIGYTPFVAGQIWNRVYADPAAPVSDEKDWAPDLVFVNYGENDDSFSRNQGVNFPADFAERYSALLREMRQAYPTAEIVLLRGGMWGGAKSEALRAAWTEAVQRLEADDLHVHHFVFQHWSDLHPRVSDHRAIANELIAWLKEQPFTKRLA